MLLTETHTYEIDNPLQKLANATHKENIYLHLMIGCRITRVEFVPEYHLHIDDLPKEADAAIAK